MKLRTLIRRSLRYHWRAQLGVVLGAAIGSAALIGALVVGDSVKISLRERALERLADFSAKLDARDRLFSSKLLARILTGTESSFKTLLDAGTNAVLGIPGNVTSTIGHSFIHLPASTVKGDGTARANHINVYGVDDAFVRRLSWNNLLALGEQGAWINGALARRLDLRVGDELVIRMAKPTAFSSEAAIASRSENSLAIRRTVRGVLPDFVGNLSVSPTTDSPLNIFVSGDELGDQLGMGGRANLMLVRAAAQWKEMNILGRFNFQKSLARIGQQPSPYRDFSWLKPGPRRSIPVSSSETVALASRQLASAWELSDAQYELRLRWPRYGVTVLELHTPRVFVETPLARAAFAADTNAQPILTYLATLLTAGTNATPYSMVTAAGSPWTPADMRDDEIVVSQWLADDLHVQPGDEIALSYFLPESGAKLIEATNTFRVRSIGPLEMPWADRTLMPDFPGIEKAESTSEWDAGFPLTYKVREKDDEYWKKFRGTPKAFITLAAGQKMWGNRFGNLTAIRFPIPTNNLPLTPALSPSAGERENRSQSPSEPKTGAGSAASEESRTEHRPSPLPGGEGQGEGERRTNLVGTSSTSSQTSSVRNGDAVERVPASVEEFRAALEKKILAHLKPEELGLRFEPVRDQALKAVEESQDFGGLFLGFSFFVIAAALLLMALLFSLGLEQRAPEIGTLLALGFTSKQVRKLLLREAVVLSLIGGVIGALGGLAYAKAMLHGLTTVWRDAVGATALNFHFTAQTLAIGIFASTVVSVITIWLALRKFVKRPARELLVGDVGGEQSRSRSLRGKIIAVTALAAGVGLVGWAVASGETANAGIFFGAGALVLVAGLSFASEWLNRWTGVGRADLPVGQDARQRVPTELSPVSFALRGCARRRKRSLATIAMLACGSFLIVSIGVFRLDANRDATKRTSGTGGFALIGETTMPVVHDLNTQSGRDFFALNEADLKGVNVVPFRVRAGDEASCLNLNAAQRPKLVGVRTELLEGRFAFVKGAGWGVLGSSRRQEAQTSIPSQSLLTSAATNEVPAIGDANSIQWAMHKKVGDTIDYVDERGQPFKVRIVGAVANSILQGQLIIDEAEFLKRFPGESGYRMFLMDAPSNAVSQVSATLSRAMQDVGLELTPTAQRLAQFNAVQNTYLGTFQVLGGLGLLLGSVGLGIVVLRNVLERRGELALLLAVGFRKPQVQRLLLLEHGALLAAGLVLGVVAAAVAVLPALLSPSAELPYASLAITLAAVLANGALWTWAATRLAVRGDLLGALRNE